METPGRLFPCRSGAQALLFPGTVALGYVSAFVMGDLTIRRWPGAISVALGIAYTGLGIADYQALGLRRSLLRRGLYLLVEAVLLVGMLALSRMAGQMWLCVFALEVATVVLLPPAWATLAVTALYAGTIAFAAHFNGTGSMLPNALSFLPAFGFVALFTRVTNREREARERAEELAAQVEALAVIQERNRLAREIHDSLGHYLTTIHVQLEAARTIHAADPARALAAVAKAEGLARDALAEVRRSVAALYADQTVASLSSRLAELVAAADGGSTAVALEILGPARPLAPEVEHALFRAAQEGLTNVRKHSHARSAGIVLDYRDPRRVVFRVQDDGRGPAGGTAGHGLAGLAERIGQVGGRVATAAPAGGGFVLSIEIPG